MGCSGKDREEYLIMYKNINTWNKETNDKKEFS